MLNEIFTTWKNNKSDLTKLQWVYACATIILVLLAGLVALLDRSLADQILRVVGLSFTVLAVNFVVWAVIGSFLQTTRRSNTKK